MKTRFKTLVRGKHYIAITEHGFLKVNEPDMLPDETTIGGIRMMLKNRKNASMYNFRGVKLVDIEIIIKTNPSE